LTPQGLAAVAARGLACTPGINPPPLPLEKKGSFLNGLQTVLDIGGLIPGVGEAFDGINAIIYAARGDYVNAGLSAAAMIPVVGSAGTVLKLAGKIDDVADVAKAGWHVGDPITKLTAKGTEPSWDAVRQRYWKNEAHNNPSTYTENVDRMQKGLAPQKFNQATGKMESLQLHHPNGRQGAEFYQVQPVTRTQHIEIHRAAK